MAAHRFSWGNYFTRLLIGIVLVFATYNPEHYSYYHWVIGDFPDFSVLKGFIGVVLLIGWVIYLRATLRSLGVLGLALALAFFGLLVWLLVQYISLPADSVRAISYIGLVVASLVLSVGVSWSHVRRRISGQVDTDDVDEV